MTMQASPRPQSFIPDQDNVACSRREAVLKDCVNIRGYSDSVVPGFRSSGVKDEEIYDLAVPLQNDLVAAGLQPEHIPPLNMKARQNLQLPSFKTLGIASRLPEVLLTPPDEATIDFERPLLPNSIPRSSSFPPSNMAKTPSPDRNHNAVILGNNISATEASGYTQAAMPATENEGKGKEKEKEKEEEGAGAMSSSSDEDDTLPDRAGWLADAVNAVMANIDLTTMSHVVNMLCHSQPCPLSNETVDAITWPNITSAFEALFSAIQEKIDSTGRFIDIVHAIPLKFNMTQIPTSPATTPSFQSIVPDYFSMNVFSKAVVAIDHQDALNTSVPSSPRPVVPPSSISVSLLERFIPPSSAEEYLHLFATDTPSVLVNRLIELSPNSGSLIFIYPTAPGAETFANMYLGPLLHPLLRTMVSIHNLSMDFGAGVGRIAAVDQMQDFEKMARKIQLLLRKLSRGTSATNIQRRTPRYTLTESSKQCVQLDRRVWTEWWVQQETGRIRAVVERYLQRGVMVPTGKEVTAATLVQEVLDGVRTRNYADYDVEREGIEVGVFVIKRTA